MTTIAGIADDPLHAKGADAVGHVPDAVRHPPWLLIAGAAGAGAVLLIALLGRLIGQGMRWQVDATLLLAARGGTMHGVPVGPAWLPLAVVDLTALGGVTVLVLIVTITGGFLATQRLWLTMALVLGGTISGSIAVSAVKALVARARPQLTDHLVQVGSASFPSGHAANSAIVYLTVALLLVQIMERRAARRFVITVAALLVAMIGCSRVYLGVHWPSDVLAGWAFGTLWAIGWWAIGAWVRLRRAGRSILHPGE